MRRDWFATGTIVVIATAVALRYLSGLDSCEPASSAGTFSCYRATPWSIPVILLIMGIGASIMVFSIAPLRKSRAKQSEGGEYDPVGGPLRVRVEEDDDFWQEKQVWEAPKAKGDFRARTVDGRKTEIENASPFAARRRLKPIPEERRLRDWAGALARREAILEATAKKIRFDQETLRFRILASRTADLVSAELDEPVATAESAMADIVARLRRLERRLGRVEALLARQEDDQVEGRDGRPGSIERLERRTLQIDEDLLRDRKDLIAVRERLLQLERDLRVELEAFMAHRDSAGQEGSPFQMEQPIDEVFDEPLVDPELVGHIAVEPVATDGPRTRRVSVKQERESGPQPGSFPKTSGTSEVRTQQGTGQIRVTKDEATHRIETVLQAAKKAVQNAHNVIEVREILMKTRASFDAGRYEEAMGHSDRILALLGSVPDRKTRRPSSPPEW